MMRKNTAARRQIQRSLTRWSACAAVALAASSTARAANEASAADGSQSLSLSQPVYMADEPAGDGLLQRQMRERNMGGSWLEQNSIRLSGYVQGGYTFNFNRPIAGTNGPGRLFDEKSDDPKFHQLSLQLKRDALISRDRFDTGFDVQVIYGADARYTQANGTNFYGSSFAGQRNLTFLRFPSGAISPVVDETALFAGQQFPENQIDLLQANISFNFPVGNGLLVKAGKFVAPWGIEQIDPTQNLLYSHSYIFSVSTPRTLTGATAQYKIDDEWTVMAGLVTGWNQSIEDNNDFPSILAQGSYKFSDEWNFVLTAIVGPEQTGNRSDYRWMVDFTADWKVDTGINVGIESVLGFEPDTSVSRERGVFTNNRQLTVTGDDSTWFGAAAYVKYNWDEQGMLTLVGRGEFFSDGDGEFLVGTEVFALSGGLIIRPFPNDEIGKNLMIRPEIRWDYANDEIYDNASRKSQITLGADLVFSF